jgi:cholesterol transport system auxiliary component
MNTRTFGLVLIVYMAVTLAGCGGLLRSGTPPDDVYVLRAAPASVGSGEMALPATLLVSRPVVQPGLESPSIAVLHPDNRLDRYTGARWAGPLPDVLAAFAAESLQSSGRFAAVNADGRGAVPELALLLSVRRFEAELGAEGTPPVVHVRFDCQVTTLRPRRVLGDCSASASIAARENRLPMVVAAFQEAAQRAMAEVVQKAAQAARP